MFEITPPLESNRDRHLADLWEREECYRYYVEQRRMNCTFMELMDLWLEVPYCSSCAGSDPFLSTRAPDIWAGHWSEDMSRHLDVITVKVIKDAGRLHCKRCGCEIAWDADDIHVVRYHLEEHYRIPLETPGQVNANKKLKQRIRELYDGRCFGCEERNTHIDHIRPRTSGGDAAFRNLQPLCDQCGQKKGATAPEEVVVYSDVYFTPPPSDGYPGLFW